MVGVHDIIQRAKKGPIIDAAASALESVSRPARTAAETVHTLGRMANLSIVKAVTRDICPTCNNLDPRNHYESSNFSRGYLEKEGESAKQRQALHDGEVWLNLNDIAAEELVKSVGRGCRYCVVLWQVLDHYFPKWYENRLETEEDFYGASIDIQLRMGWPIIIEAVNFADEYPAGGSFEIYKPRDANLPGWSLIPHIGTTGQRYHRSDDVEVYDFILQSLEICNKEHPQCGSRRSTRSSLPTRVIDLGDNNGSIKLYESGDDEEGTYAALSHCWGRGSPLTTTSKTIEARKASLDWEDLPATFQNTIEILRRLHIRYVWIDSLCIIQNSREDWERESAKMADIYHNAYITIAAGSSPGPGTPFLAERNSLWTPFSLIFEETDGSESYLNVRRKILGTRPISEDSAEPRYSNRKESEGPLYGRAWTFQEQMLSTRIIHYAPGAVIWECKTLRCCEDQLPPFASTLDIPGSEQELVKGNLELDLQWRRAVTSYTRRSLTFESDKFPGLSGIATDFSGRKKSRYLAGLWEGSMLTDLLWHPSPTKDRRVTEIYIAPSWSWASLAAPINWNTYNIAEMYASVVNAECTLKGFNPFGELNGGWIELRGPVSQVWLKKTPGKLADVYYVNNSGQKSKEYFFHADTTLYEDQGLLESGQFEPTLSRARLEESLNETLNEYEMSVWLLCILRDKKGLRDVIGLVLGRSTTVPGAFERLGSAWKLPLDFYRQAREMTVKII